VHTFLGWRESPVGPLLAAATDDALCLLQFSEAAAVEHRLAELARRIGDTGATRAVGAANGANPLAIVIPCHRVVNANGDLGGYGGGLWRKRILLDLERGQGRLPF
jgi:methylated-DNA-[protein]-cysteine S-methyltransferase